MTHSDRLDPRLVFAARLLLASAFIFSGVVKLADFGGATAEVRALTGLEPAAVFAALVIATQLGGSILLIAGGRAGVFGAVILAGFTIAASILGHPFWLREGTPFIRDATTFLEHLGLVAGLLLAGFVSVRRRDGV